MPKKPVACDLDALAEDERRERARLASEMGASIVAVREISDGYEVTFASSGPNVAQLRQLVDLERRCCSFLTFELRSDGEELQLKITGPDSAKQFRG